MRYSFSNRHSPHTAEIKGNKKQGNNNAGGMKMMASILKGSLYMAAHCLFNN